MPLRTFENSTPDLHPSVFVADTAEVIGNVELGPESSVWYGAVLRGDINRIIVGKRSNIQDGSVFHVTSRYPVRLGNNVTVGHRAIVHGCTIGNDCLIGMGAIILDNATVGDGTLVAAGAVVLQNAVVPERSLVAGVPARVIRTLSDDEVREIRESADHYVDYAVRHRLKSGEREA